jgi:hypothetical protein
MGAKLMLMWVSLLGASVLGAGCVGGTSSPIGPSTVPQAAPPASPGPAPTPFVRYVAVATNHGLRPSSAWGIAYASDLQTARNRALAHCESANGGIGCGNWLECSTPITDRRIAYYALAMSPFSSSFPLGRTGSLVCGGLNVAAVERDALFSCNPHLVTGPCHISWSGYME